MLTRYVFRNALLTMFAAVAFTSSAGAQNSASLSIIQTRPQGQLGRNIGPGIGVGGSYQMRLDAAGILSLRADVGIVSYDDETYTTGLGGGIGGRVQVDVKTSNYILPASLSGEIARPGGQVHPYVSAGVGIKTFFTESRVEGSADHQAFAATTNHSDVAASWVAGAGVYFAVGRAMLDIGAQYVGGGNAEYLARGSIVDLPDGQVKVSPLRSATNLVLFRVGARFTR